MEANSTTFSLLILKVNDKALKAQENFLKHRGITIFTAINLQDALAQMFKYKPQFILIPVDHPNSKVRVLPKILAQSFPVKPIGYTTSSTGNSIQALRNFNSRYKLMPPVSGPAIERMILKIKKDEEAELERMKAVDKKKVPIHGAEESSDAVISSAASKKSDMIFFKDTNSAESKEAMEKARKSLMQFASDETSAADAINITGGIGESGEYAFTQTDSTSQEGGIYDPGAEDPDGTGSYDPGSKDESSGGYFPEGSGGKKKSGIAYDPTKKGQESGNAYNPSGSGEGAGGGYFPGGTGAEGRVGAAYNPNQSQDSSGTGYNPDGSNQVAGGRAGAAYNPDHSGENDPMGVHDTGDNAGKANRPYEYHPSGGRKKKRGASGEEEDGEESSDVESGAESASDQGAQSGANESGTETPATEKELEEARQTARERNREENFRGKRVYGADEGESIFIKGTVEALEKTVVKGGETQVEKLGESSNVACISVDSPKFSGYLVAALGKNKKIDEEFIQNIKKKLHAFLKANGEDVKDDDAMGMKIEQVDFQDWALEQADFLKKSIHHGDEVAMAFFPREHVITQLEGSKHESMLTMSLDEVKGDTTLDFDLYIHMPVNDKYLLYTPQGGVFLGTQKDRLLEKGITHMHLRKESVKDVKKYRTQLFLNEKIQEYKAKKKGTSH